MSDSSDISSSDEDKFKHEHKKLKTHYFEDGATYKFYTKDESQEDLRYVANNAYKAKKSKKNKYRKKSSHSKDQSQIKVIFHFSIIIYLSL